MDTVTFKVNNKENKEFNFSISEDKIKDIRERLCDEYDEKDKFCKIECILEYPIRKFGILTLNPGVLGDIYDEEKLERFNIGGKTIDIKVEFEEKKVEMRKKIKNNVSKSRFRYNKKENKEFVYKEDDFPPLS
jgi:hypothetical protein